MCAVRRAEKAVSAIIRASVQSNVAIEGESCLSGSKRGLCVKGTVSFTILVGAFILDVHLVDALACDPSNCATI